MFAMKYHRVHDDHVLHVLDAALLYADDLSVFLDALADVDGTTIQDSTIIIEYLSAKYPSSGACLIPVEPSKAAKVWPPKLSAFNKLHQHFQDECHLTAQRRCGQYYRCW